MQFMLENSILGPRHPEPFSIGNQGDEKTKMESNDIILAFPFGLLRISAGATPSQTEPKQLDCLPVALFGKG